MSGNDQRLRSLLEKLRAFALWDKRLKGGAFLGVAATRCFGSYIGLVIEVEQSGGSFLASKAWACVDCGLAVDPDTVKAQIEGGILFGLSAALYGEITVEDGRVVQSNFHDQPVISLKEAPSIEVDIIASDADPGGIGECAVPPVAPALANALYRADGQRRRVLPLKAS